jgi:hypothetical protein
VFEIDEDIAEEAVYIINDLMINKTVKNLGWIVPLKTDIEFGDDWTVPFNLIAMTNPKETKPEVWSERWKRVFPNTYKSYLDSGGSPNGVVEQTKEQAPKTDTKTDLKVITSDSGEFVYQIQSHRLTPELAKTLAIVVRKCEGRGSDTIAIQNESGEDLLGMNFKASFSEFKIIASYEGL